MAFFITVQEALQEFDGLTEVQILEIINRGLANPCDDKGNYYNADAYNAFVLRRIQDEKRYLHSEYTGRLRRELGWGGPSRHNTEVKRLYSEAIQDAEKSMPRYILHSMKFQRTEFKLAIENHCPDVYINYESPTQERMHIRIKHSLFSGKRIEIAYSNLKEEGYDNDVIAFIFIKKNKFNLTETGKMLSEEEREKGVEREEKIYRERAKSLADNADRKYLFTFVE